MVGSENEAQLFAKRVVGALAWSMLMQRNVQMVTALG
jgi:hypothetical protein